MLRVTDSGRGGFPHFYLLKSFTPDLNHFVWFVVVRPVSPEACGHSVGTTSSRLCGSQGLISLIVQLFLKLKSSSLKINFLSVFFLLFSHFPFPRTTRTRFSIPLFIVTTSLF